MSEFLAPEPSQESSVSQTDTIGGRVQLPDPMFHPGINLAVGNRYHETRNLHESLLLPGFDLLYMDAMFVSPDGKMMDVGDQGESLYPAVVYGLVLGDFVSAAMASWPIHNGRLPVKRFVEHISSVAFQMDSALNTCDGDYVGTLRAGMLRWTIPDTEGYNRRSQYEPRLPRGHKMPPGVDRNRVLSPTLAFIAAYEWFLMVSEECGSDRQLSLEESVANLATHTSTPQTDTGVHVPTRRMPTVDDLCNSFVRTLMSLCRRVYGTIFPDYFGGLFTERHISRMIEAEFDTLERMFYAAREVQSKAPPDVSARELLKQMLRVAKMNAAPLNETLDRFHKGRLKAIAQGSPDTTSKIVAEWDKGEDFEVVKDMYQKMPTKSDGDVIIRFNIGDGVRYPLICVPLDSDVKGLNDILIEQRFQLGLPVVSASVINHAYTHSFSIGDEAITTTLYSTAWKCRSNFEKPIVIECKPQYSVLQFHYASGLSIGDPFACNPNKTNANNLNEIMNNTLKNSPAQCYTFYIGETRLVNLLTREVDVPRGNSVPIKVKVIPDVAFERSDDPKWEAWAKVAGIKDSDLLSKPAIGRNERDLLADKLRSLSHNKVAEHPNQIMKALNNLIHFVANSDPFSTDNLVLARDSVCTRDAPSTEKRVATAVLKSIKALLELEDNPTKDLPSIVVYNGRDGRTKGPFAIVCGCTSQRIELVDILAKAFGVFTNDTQEARNMRIDILPEFASLLG